MINQIIALIFLFGFTVEGGPKSDLVSRDIDENIKIEEVINDEELIIIPTALYIENVTSVVSYTDTDSQYVTMETYYHIKPKSVVKITSVMIPSGTVFAEDDLLLKDLDVNIYSDLILNQMDTSDYKRRIMSDGFFAVGTMHPATLKILDMHKIEFGIAPDKTVFITEKDYKYCKANNLTKHFK